MPGSDGRRGPGKKGREKGPYFVYILLRSLRTRFKRPFKMGEAYYTKNRNGRDTDAITRARGQNKGGARDKKGARDRGHATMPYSQGTRDKKGMEGAWAYDIP